MISSLNNHEKAVPLSEYLLEYSKVMPDLGKFFLVWACPMLCKSLNMPCLPTNVSRAAAVMVLTQNSASNCQMPPDAYHPIENHCFKPQDDLIHPFPSCSVQSGPSLYSLMLSGTSRTQLTTVAQGLADVAVLGLDPAAVAHSLTYLLPLGASGVESTDWESEEPRFYPVPHQDDVTY